MKKLILSFFIIINLISCINENDLKYLDSNLSVDERLDDLIPRMTLEEKVAQMVQFVGLNYITDADRNMTAEEILNSDSRASYRGLLKKDIAQMVADGKIGSFFFTTHSVVGKPKSPPNIPLLGLLSSKKRFGFILMKNTKPLLIGFSFLIGFAGIFSTKPSFRLKQYLEIRQASQLGFFGLQTALAKSINA